MERNGSFAASENSSGLDVNQLALRADAPPVRVDQMRVGRINYGLNARRGRGHIGNISLNPQWKWGKANCALVDLGHH
jgi:hypothetical protein